MTPASVSVPSPMLTRPMLTPIVNDRFCQTKCRSVTRLPQPLGDADRVRGQAVLEQHAELVATQARQRVALAQPLAEHEADLPHQLVAGGMARRVVDELELIEIEIEHRVMPAVLARAREREVQPTLELAPVDEPGQRVVARLIGEPRRVVALVAHVAQHQYARR